MKKEVHNKVEIAVRTFKHEPIADAQVRIRLVGPNEGREVALKYDKRTETYVTTDVEPGYYLLTASTRGYQSDSREVQVDPGGLKDVFVLGKKGMPFYYRGQVRVPFDPPSDRVGVALEAGVTEKDLRSLKELAKKLELSEDKEVPPEVREEGVVIYVMPSSAEEKVQSVLDVLSEHSAVRNAGHVIEIGEKTATFLTPQLIVRFKPNVKDNQVLKIAAKYDMTVVRSIPYAANAWLLTTKGQATYDLLGLCEALVKTGDVVYAEPNLVETAVDLAINPTDYVYPEQWHIPLVSLPDAWETLRNANPPGVNPGDPGDLTFGSEDIVIAVLDRGIQSNTVGGITTPSHPDFTGNVTGGASKVSQFFDFATMVSNNDAPPNDHGMGCASVAAARVNNASIVPGVNEGVGGAAPNCRLMGLIRPAGGTNQRYADAYIWITGFDPAWTVDGVNYAVGTVFPAAPTDPADIITNSFGWSSAPLAGIMQDAFDYVTSYGRGGSGVATFWAAGNYGIPTQQVLFAAALYPKVMAVGASSLANDGVTEIKADYSAIGNAIEFCTPSHDAYVGGNPLHNPSTNYGVISADLLGQGNMPGHPAQTTTLSVAAGPSAGAITINVASSAGFAASQAALIGVPGAADTEAQLIVSVPSATQVRVTMLHNAHPAGSAIASGPANYRNNFGGTSSACPLAGGIAALCLSINPNLSWVELRQILRTTAERIDLTNATATGQWVDTTGDGVDNFSQWYGWGRLNANDAVIAARDYDHDSDVVVRDNLLDAGVVPSAGWHAVSPDIWADPNNVPIPAIVYTDAPPHFNPIREQDNYVFVRVKNVGTVASSDFWVRAMITHFPGFEFRYPEEWSPSNMPGQPVPSPLEPGTYLIGEVNISSLGPGADQIVKMTWPESLVPDDTVTVGGMTVTWHPCLLAEASPHDGPPPSGATFDVKRYNNLAQRNITIDDPDSSDADLVTAVVAGTSNPVGVDSVIIDRSLVPADYRVFARVADERHMKHWLTLFEQGRIRAAKRLPGSIEVLGEPSLPAEYSCEELKRSEAGECYVTLLDPARLSVRCGNKEALIIHARECTQLEFRCGGKFDAGSPSLSRGLIQGRDVIFFDGGSPAIEIPLRLAGNQFVPVILGLSRPHSRRGYGLLFATQRRADGELSAGFSIQG